MQKHAKRVIDTNIILRFFVEDDQKKASRTQKLFSKTDEKLLIPDVVIAEIAWTLLSHYRQSKQNVIKKISSLSTVPNLEFNKTLISKTLSLWKEQNIDFIDAYLAAYVQEENLDGIYSYDKGISKVKDIKRFEP